MPLSDHPWVRCTHIANECEVVELPSLLHDVINSLRREGAEQLAGKPLRHHAALPQQADFVGIDTIALPPANHSAHDVDDADCHRHRLDGSVFRCTVGAPPARNQQVGR